MSATGQRRVQKSGDTFSNADSALGKSSIITGTTAGATQFSDVSQTRLAIPVLV